MQEDKEKYINELKDKIKTIIGYFERVKEENEQLFKERQELITQNKLKEEKIKELQKELENVKIASVLSDTSVEGESEAKHNAKIKINKMVREIDKCISLLNKLN